MGETGISISRSCYLTIVLSTYITVRVALCPRVLCRTRPHGTGEDRPYVHDSGRGRGAVCVSMRSGKGDKRFFCIRDLVRGFGGNATVIGAQMAGWWHLAAVKAFSAWAHAYGEMLLLLLFGIRGDCTSSPARGGKRGVCIVRIAFHLVQTIPLTMALPPVARINNAKGDLAMICG